MNKAKLKSYAPKARREFIQAVTDRAHFYGLSENTSEIQTVEEKGDVALIPLLHKAIDTLP
jgi:transcription elongation GreA/GreB family factor